MCIRDRGNSYLPSWSVDWYRVKHVFGDSRAPRGSKEATPIKASEVGASPVNKIVLGDWHWNGSRDVNDKKSIWHNYKGRRYYNMLFGDSHVEAYVFPKEYVGWQTGLTPDPSYKWLSLIHISEPTRLLSNSYAVLCLKKKK